MELVTITGTLSGGQPVMVRGYNTKQGMMDGTSPSIASLGGGDFQIAFQANTTELVTVNDSKTYMLGGYNTGQGMMKGTSPSIAAFRDRGFQIAFQANTRQLVTILGDGNDETGLRGGFNTGRKMNAGSSPSIAAAQIGPWSVFRIAFQTDAGRLQRVTGYEFDTRLSDANGAWWPMAPGTSPSIISAPNGRFGVAYQDNSHALAPIILGPSPAPPCGVLPPGGELRINDSVTSCDGRHQLIMQSAGNLVLYGHGDRPLWSSFWQGAAGTRATMQTDGNFVLYDSNNTATWAFYTANHPNAFLNLQDNGDLVVDDEDGHFLKNLGTLDCGQLARGEFLGRGVGDQYPLRSCNGSHELRYSGDGNVVIYNGGGAANGGVVVWSTGISSAAAAAHPLGYAGMASDGAFALWDAYGVQFFRTAIGGAFIWMQDDGDLVIYSGGPNPVALWSSGTSGK
jgi:hypothetical protein